MPLLCLHKLLSDHPAEHHGIYSSGHLYVASEFWYFWSRRVFFYIYRIYSSVITQVSLSHAIVTAFSIHICQLFYYLPIVLFPSTLLEMLPVFILYYIDRKLASLVLLRPSWSPVTLAFKGLPIHPCKITASILRSRHSLLLKLWDLQEPCDWAEKEPEVKVT